jgi:hypothetical protein
MAKKVSIEADTTHIDNTLRRLRGDVRQINTEEDVVIDKLRHSWHQFSHLSGMMLQILGQSQKASVAMQMIQIANTAIDIQRYGAMATAAFATQHYGEGIILMMEAMELGMLRIQMLQNIEQQRYQQTQTEQLANMVEAYQ